MGKVRFGEISINMKIHHIKASILGNNLYLALMHCKCNVKARLDIPVCRFFLNLFSLGLSRENSRGQAL